eukprot:scaffold111060_cov18-Tisochrysis_lutea.AAC.2
MSSFSHTSLSLPCPALLHTHVGRLGCGAHGVPTALALPCRHGEGCERPEANVAEGKLGACNEGCKAYKVWPTA